MEETPLTGGWVTKVVRIGGTVRRDTGPWTPAVHALLRHLEAAGFDAAPRVLGIDEHGREVLTYIEGEAAHAPWPARLRTDGSLADVALLLRRFHDAVASFHPSSDALWRAGPKPLLTGEIVRHGDFAPWNIIWREDEPVGIIDWDFAVPGPPILDVAQLALAAIPLSTDNIVRDAGFSSPPDFSRRLSVICDAYGRVESAEVLAAIDDMQHAELARLLEYGTAGREPWATFLRRGERERIEADMAWLRGNRWRLG
jgi:hypothetical protein